MVTNFNGITALTGVLGLLALIVFWIAAAQEGIKIFSSEHAWRDAVVLFLVSIAFGIGTLIHRKEERQRQ